MASTPLFAFVIIFALSSAAARNILADEHKIPIPMADSGLALRGMSPAVAVAAEFGGLGLRALGRRACGNALLFDTCEDDPTKCCAMGSKCCPGGSGCCPSDLECQVNFLKATLCCPKGVDCTKDTPPVSTDLSGIEVDIGSHRIFSHRALVKMLRQLSAADLLNAVPLVTSVR